ncbi:MAG: YeeE/YedE family protein [Sedimentisphaerales bacterium]|nr:YeeE/YedE family protein [Sedimentisphaerales bacterium]
MINTMYQLDTLDSAQAFIASLLIGAAFGFFLERAGFGSSRKLSGVFYFKDMTVIKVMFTAVITAALGLILCIVLGIVSIDGIYLMPTVYGAYIVGGLIFGVGFVMGGWCPGTAAAGMASGKIDAIIFLVGAILGSAVFNEMFGLVKPLYESGQSGVVFIYDTLGMSRETFSVLLCIAAIVMFWGCEWIEKRKTAQPILQNSTILKTLSIAVLAMAFMLVAVKPGLSLNQLPGTMTGTTLTESQLLEAVEMAQDHIEPEELADRMLRQEPGLIVVDIRPVVEYMDYHLPNALNIQMKDLHQALVQYKNAGTIVLYSNGMTHPVQARDSLYRNGYNNAFILTDGINGFIEKCLTPVSLRDEILPKETTDKIRAWRAFFLGSTNVQSESYTPQEMLSDSMLIDAESLEKQLERADTKILDLRSQTEYNTSHIKNSFSLNIENLRTNLNGVGSMLQPRDMLTRHFSSMGIQPDDNVVIVYGNKTQDATLVGIALERIGHKSYKILNGGFAAWKSVNKPVVSELPETVISSYPNNGTDNFSVDYKTVLQYVKSKKAIIIDVRPSDYFSGSKSDEARAGHIPGAVNRPYTEDIIIVNETAQFKPIEELAKAYEQIIPSKDSTVIVHCRTGHQASQTFFVLKRLLGYRNVLWYDAGWSQWAAIKDLPIE